MLLGRFTEKDDGGPSITKSKHGTLPGFYSRRSTSPEARNVLVRIHLQTWLSQVAPPV